MKSTLPAFCLFILITAFSLRGLGQGVTTPSFGSSAVTESFEGIPTDGNNFNVGPGFSVPVTPFTFPSSKITLTEPDPNGQWHVNIVDGANVSTGWNICPSNISTSTDVPDGKAFLAGYNPTVMTFTFPVLAEKVGMYVEGTGAGCGQASPTITLTAYNASGGVIGTFTTQGTGIASNWKNHFIGYNSTTDGIAKITLTGPALVIDKLTFEKQQECLTTPTFGPSAITESFERINGPGSVNTQPATPFTFRSGITLTEPNPNTGQVLIGDWARGDAPRYFCNGKGFTATDVPDSTAYLSMMNATSTLTFTLPAPSSKVGMYVEGLAGTCVTSTAITLTAYNASNEVIGSCTTAATVINDGSNWKSHFLGFRSLSDGIAKITISGPYIMIDKLTFEPLPCVSKTWYLDADNDGYYVGSGKTSCLPPGTGYRNTGLLGGDDCDDTNAQIKPGTVWYFDFDNDGYYNGSGVTSCASPGTGYRDSGLLGGDDCNNYDAQINPATVWYLDADNDGYYVGSGVPSCTSPGTGYRHTGLLGGNDCYDEGASVWQSKILYIDDDGDGYDAGTTSVCYGATVPPLYSSTTLGSDCDDQNGYVNPGVLEICGDGIDNNCNGQVDENCGSCQNATSLTTTNITATSARLNWVAQANPVQWQVQYKSTAPGSKWKDVSVTATARAVTITALKAKQSYNWHIRAKCGTKWLSYSNAITFKTPSSTQSTPIVQTRPLEEPTNVVETNSRLTLHPNPTNGRFIINLHLSNNNSTKAKIELVNMLGQTVSTENGSIANGKLQQTVSMSSSAAHGMYIVRIIANNKIYQQKLIYTK